MLSMLLGQLGCGNHETAEQIVPAKPTSASAPKVSDAPRNLPREALPLGRHDPAIAPLLSRLTYKPDPYATQPGCISEPQSQQREAFTLWVEMSLSAQPGAPQTVRLGEVSYAVSTTSAEPLEEPPESIGIPRLALVHADGRLSHVDFEGSYREPHSKDILRTSDATPRDPTWVRSWLASAPITKDVIEHRIELDGRVLSQVKRPRTAPRLSAIECDDTGQDGLKLSWRATSEDAQVPLQIEVLRYENGQFAPELPSAPAREVTGFTLLPKEAGEARRDLILLVTLTDTFRFVTRGALVPKRALTW